MPNSVDFYEGIFLHVVHVRIIVSCLTVETCFSFFIYGLDKYRDVFMGYQFFHHELPFDSTSSSTRLYNHMFCLPQGHCIH